MQGEVPVYCLGMSSDHPLTLMRLWTGQCLGVPGGGILFAEIPAWVGLDLTHRQGLRLSLHTGKTWAMRQARSWLEGTAVPKPT